MERLNEVRFIGNVGMVKKGDKYVFFSVAINESYKVKDEEEWTEKTVWVNITAFGNTMNKFEKQNIEKGDGILVVGKLDSSTYEEKTQLKVIASKIQVIQKRNSGTASADKYPSEYDENTKTTGHDVNQKNTEPTSEDDLPF